MKKLSRLLLFLILLGGSHCQASKHVIGYEKLSGLFYSFLGVINNLIWCKKNDRKPVVYWGPHSLYYEKKGYHGKDNVWEYYFEPVSTESYHVGDNVWDRNAAPDLSQIRPITLNFCDQYEQKEVRQAAHSIINEHIKLRPYIAQKIDAFFQKEMAGKKTLGIHLRGTDKKLEIVPINIDTLLNDANAFAKQFSDCQFLVATDEERLLKRAQSVLKGKVLYYDAHRSIKGKALHNDKEIKHKGVLGEEVIIEAYLLSRCDLFLHTCSSVSTGVLFLNPNLEHKMYKAQ